MRAILNIGNGRWGWTVAFLELPKTIVTDDSKSSGENIVTTPAASNTETKSDTPKISFADLAKGHRIVRIVHGESVYELRLTRNGRLILSK